MSEDKNCVNIPKGLFDEKKELEQRIEKYEKIIEIARNHIKDIHYGYEEYIKKQYNVKVSPIDILKRIERIPGYSYIRRRMLSKEDDLIINFRIPEEALVLYEEKND